MSDIAQYIAAGQASLGIEFGSTRIKAVLVGPDCAPVAQGAFDWENRLENGVWTYHDDEIWDGLRAAYAALAADVEKKHGVRLERLAAIGFSAMMHGYLAFGADGTLLVPFRTWRNTITGDAAAELSELFSFNVPQRWSIAHLHQAVRNGEAHVPAVRFLTTLAGYVHWKLTGRKVLGVGDASGVFPIDSATLDYDARMVAAYDALVAPRGLPWKLRDLLPEVLPAGADAGALTEEGARILDPTGALQAGIPLAPPEGDAGTGMVATNSVAARTGNVSAGTSVFAMAVLERPLKSWYPEIDIVTTPTGKAVAMVHCNTCTSDLNAWIELLGEAAAALGAKFGKGKLYDTLFEKALDGAPDAAGVVACNYLAGEPVTGFSEGRPLVARLPDAKLSLGDFMRAQIYSAVATLRLGMDILFEKERVALDSLFGHGGLFKAPVVGQQILADALGVPVTCLSTAGEGGPWGMALLAAYRAEKADGETLEDFLARRVFASATGSTRKPSPEGEHGFARWLVRYHGLLEAERAAVAAIHCN